MTLSPPVRVAAIVAALVLTGLGAFTLFLGGGVRTETATPAPPVTTKRPQVSTAPGPAAPKPSATSRKPSLNPSLPVPVAKALRNRQVVVVAVYVPGAQVDALVVREARAGAKMSVAGFVPVSASSETALEKIVAKAGVLPAPAIVIFERPGVVASTLGVADRQTVAAAVAQAKKRR